MLPIKTPMWVHRHLLENNRSNHIQPALSELIRIGLSRFQSKHPKVSIVMPVYNEGDNILPGLSSLSQLLLPQIIPTELLLISDGSSAHQTLLNQLELRTIRMFPEQNLNMVRRVALQQARGEIVLFAAGDTYYPPAWGKEYVQALQASSEISMIYGSYALVPEEGKSRLSYLLHETLQQYLNPLHKLPLEVQDFNSALRRDQALQFEILGHGTPNHPFRLPHMLQKIGQLRHLRSAESLVWTQNPRLYQNGSLLANGKKLLQREEKPLLDFSGAINSKPWA